MRVPKYIFLIIFLSLLASIFVYSHFSVCIDSTNLLLFKYTGFKIVFTQYFKFLFIFLFIFLLLAVLYTITKSYIALFLSFIILLIVFNFITVNINNVMFISTLLFLALLYISLLIEKISNKYIRILILGIYSLMIALLILLTNFYSFILIFPIFILMKNKLSKKEKQVFSLCTLILTLVFLILFLKLSFLYKFALILFLLITLLIFSEKITLRLQIFIYLIILFISCYFGRTIFHLNININVYLKIILTLIALICLSYIIYMTLKKKNINEYVTIPVFIILLILFSWIFNSLFIYLFLLLPLIGILYRRIESQIELINTILFSFLLLALYATFLFTGKLTLFHEIKNIFTVFPSNISVVYGSEETCLLLKFYKSNINCKPIDTSHLFSLLLRPNITKNKYYLLLTSKDLKIEIFDILVPIQKINESIYYFSIYGKYYLVYNLNDNKLYYRTLRGNIPVFCAFINGQLVSFGEYSEKCYVKVPGGILLVERKLVESDLFKAFMGINLGYIKPVFIHFPNIEEIIENKENLEKWYAILEVG